MEIKARKSSLDTLNFNLKNEIFSFLPFMQVLNELTKLNRRTLYTVKKKRDFKILFKNISILEETINFSRKELRLVGRYFSSIGLSEGSLAEIYIYLLNRKYKSNNLYFVYIYFLHSDYNFVCQFLKQNLTLRAIAFRFDRYFLNENKIKNIFKIIENSNILIKLNFSNNFLGDNDYDIVYLAKMIKNNPCLKELNLSSNLVGQNPNDMPLLANALLINKTLEKLDLFNNFLGINEKNIDCICEIIKHNKVLKFLDVSNNLIVDDFSLLKIENALDTNSTLSSFSLYLRNSGEVELRLFRDMKYVDKVIVFAFWLFTFFLFFIVLANTLKKLDFKINYPDRFLSS